MNDKDDVYPGALPFIDNPPYVIRNNRMPIDMQQLPYLKNDNIGTCRSDSVSSGYVDSAHGATLTGGSSLAPCPERRDKPTKGHNGGSNYVNCDGSAKYRTWSQVRKNDFDAFKLMKPNTTVTP